MKSRYFWPASFYFIFFAALSIQSPFLALYYQSLGFTGTESGILLGVLPLVFLVASPFWTGLADTRHSHKLILTITLLMTVIISAFIPAFRSFISLVPVILVLAIFAAPHIPLVDSATMSMLGEQRNSFGRVRLWGTISWGICAPIAGLILQRFGILWIFWGFSIILSLNLIVTQKLVFTRSQTSVPFWHGIRQILKDRKWVTFLLMVFIISIGSNVHNTYLSLLFDKFNASKSTLGVAFTLSTLFELPVMFFSSALLHRFKAKGLLFIVMAATGLRCLIYFAAGSPVVLMASQLLHGFTFPALALAGVTYAAENAPPGLTATSQGVFSSVMMGFGSATASLLGGALIDGLGVAGMYGFIGILVLVSLAGFLLQDRIEIRKLASQK